MYVLTMTNIKKSMGEFSEELGINTEVKYVSSDLEQIKEEFECLRYSDDDCIDEYCRASTEDKLVQGATFYDEIKDEYCQLDIHEV